MVEQVLLRVSVRFLLTRFERAQHDDNVPDLEETLNEIMALLPPVAPASAELVEAAQTVFNAAEDMASCDDGDGSAVAWAWLPAFNRLKDALPALESALADVATEPTRADVGETHPTMQEVREAVDEGRQKLKEGIEELNREHRAAMRRTPRDVVVGGTTLKDVLARAASAPGSTANE